MSFPITKYYFIINANSNQGNGLKKWTQAREQILSIVPGAVEIITTSSEDLEKKILPLINSDRQAGFISVGGDGSIHYLCNLLMAHQKGGQHVVGAVGTGSSNDFLKPFKNTIGGIPYILNIDSLPPSYDIGKVDYTDATGNKKKRYFVINASFGITARGNWNFNNPDYLLKKLKKQHVGAAIMYTSIKTIFTSSNIPVEIDFNGRSYTSAISNINILMRSYISGSLHYPGTIPPQKLGLHICEDLDKIQLVKTLFDLEKGIFKTGRQKQSFEVNTFKLRSPGPVSIEFDGETDLTTEAIISIIPNAIRFLNP